MFKLAFVLVAIAGFTSASILPAPVVSYNQPRGVLDDVLAEFAALVDTDQIAGILLSYLFDPEFQIAMQFLFSPEFQALYLEVADLPEVIEFIQFLIDSGLNVYGITDTIRAFLGIPPRVANTFVRTRAGLNGLLWDIIGILPRDELRELAEYHVENTPEFAELFERLRSPEFAGLADQVFAHPTVQGAIVQLHDSSIDVYAIIEILNSVLEWNLGQ